VTGIGNFPHQSSNIDGLSYDCGPQSTSGDRGNKCNFISRLENCIGVGENLIYGDARVVGKYLGSG
jgi:hypothetical protein